MHGPQLWYAEQFNGASVVPAAGFVVADAVLVGFPAVVIVLAGGFVVTAVALVGFA